MFRSSSSTGIYAPEVPPLEVGSLMTTPRPDRRPPTPELIQRQARALGDPTRYDIFRFVADARGPVRVTTLAEYLGFNHNAVRQHLAKLTDAGLLTEARSSGRGTGRPPLEYRLATTAMGSWGAPGPYELLALLLLDVAKGTRTPVEAGAEAGRALAASTSAGNDPVDILETEMARRGFEPRRETHGPVTEIVLERCPFVAAASTDPDVVCELHRGFAMGILDGMGADEEVRDLVVHPPAQAGCRLLLERRPTEPLA